MPTIYFKVTCYFTDATWKIFSLMGHREISRIC